MGGWNGAYDNDVWYSTDGVTWTEATSSAEWAGRYDQTSVVFDGKMWVIGGYNGSFLNDVWYSTDGVTWTEATDSAAWVGRDYGTSVVFDGKMWLYGGYSTDYHNDVWYSADGVTWTQATASADWDGRYSHASTVFDDKIWVLGGYSGGARVNDVWYTENYYTLSFDEQGGDNLADINDLVQGATTTLPGAAVREGYTFLNWNTQANGGGTSYAAGATYTMGSSYTILYAIWEQTIEEPGISGGSYSPPTTSSSSGGSGQSQTEVIRTILENLISLYLQLIELIQAEGAN
ncbi:MAG: InlB B-repeat-containing protein [Candidatus Paceibacterota bacterium]